MEMLLLGVFLSGSVAWRPVLVLRSLHAWVIAREFTAAQERE